jgi:hypothetical protein
VTSDPNKLVSDLLENDEVDPKQLAMQAQMGTDAFEEVMGNFNRHMHDLAKRAKESGALAGNEPEVMVMKCLLMIAANDFFPGDVPGFKKTLRNLQKFL